MMWDSWVKDKGLDSYSKTGSKLMSALVLCLNPILDGNHMEMDPGSAVHAVYLCHSWETPVFKGVSSKPVQPCRECDPTMFYYLYYSGQQTNLLSFQEGDTIIFLSVTHKKNFLKIHVWKQSLE